MLGDEQKYRGRESNPYDPYGPQDFKSCASTYSATSASQTTFLE